LLREATAKGNDMKEALTTAEEVLHRTIEEALRNEQRLGMLETELSSLQSLLGATEKKYAEATAELTRVAVTLQAHVETLQLKLVSAEKARAARLQEALPLSKEDLCASERALEQAHFILEGCQNDS
jgi:hypothetical protein